jgi:hypothetical protein
MSPLLYSVPMPDYSPHNRMTIRSLIVQLSAFDPDTLVLVNGYEGGYQTPQVCSRRVAIARTTAYQGPWDDARDGDKDVEDAVIVSRGEYERTWSR